MFVEVFTSLPRQGPGSRENTARALAACEGLPPTPRVLDLGAGSGAQTLDLADLTDGTIVAVDAFAPLVERLRSEVEARGLSGRVRPMVGDMGALDLEPGSFDLIWSEGALYSIGLDTALPVCRSLLRPGGWLAFTDAVWRVEEPPGEVRAVFDADYPTMGRVPDVLQRIERAGLRPVEHFPVSDSAWWDDFYTPLEQRIEALREQHAQDPETLAALDELAAEPALHRRHGSTYGYEFFVARRDP